METQVHTVAVTLDWGLLAAVSKLDRFDASWAAIERREGQSLKQLKAIATVRSVGASTRIEGSRMSDAEVDVLLRNTDITKLEDRDSQEVVGYFQVLDLIAESYADIDITENSLKGLHSQVVYNRIHSAVIIRTYAKRAWYYFTQCFAGLKRSVSPCITSVHGETLRESILRKS